MASLLHALGNFPRVRSLLLVPPHPTLSYATTNQTLYSDSQNSLIALVSHGRNSFSASQSVNSFLKASCPYASIRSSRGRSLPRPSKTRSPKTSLTRARYETHSSCIQPAWQLTSYLGLWPRESKIRFHLRLVLADPKCPLHTIRRPAQNLVPHWPLADTLPARSVLWRDHTLCHILLDLQPHFASPFPPTFVLRHLRSGREVWFQQADGQIVVD